MKNKFIILTIFIAIITLSLVSCLKEKENISPISKSNPIEEEIISEIETNAIIVGQSHNAGLEYMLEVLKSENPENFSRELLIEIYDDYMHNFIENFDEYPDFLQPLEFYIAYHDSNANPDLYLETVINGLSFSENAEAILYSFNEIINNDSSSYEETIESITALIEVSKTNISDTTELAITLSTLYTGIYSAEYWYNHVEDWYSLTGMKAASWKDHLRADGTGAVLGGLVGASVGAVACGVGSLPGWAAGAISGGLINSGMSCMDEILSWF